MCVYTYIFVIRVLYVKFDQKVPVTELHNYFYYQ